LNQRYKTVRDAAEIQKSDDPHPAQKTDDNSATGPLQGRHTWTTEDGVVVIDEQADMVFITESLDDATTAALEKEVLSAPSAPK